jgi:quercetin dioxygenase-like cupin family protein
VSDKTINAYEDLQFGPLGEGSPVEAALLWGDPATGPAAVLVRFPAGFSEPLHSHSSTYRAVLVKGEFKSRGSDGSEPETVYGPGSFVLQPGGEVHAEMNVGDDELVALVHFDGPVDFVLAD